MPRWLLTYSRTKCDSWRCLLTCSLTKCVYSQTAEQSVTDLGVHYIQQGKARLLTNSRAKCDGPRWLLTYSGPGVHLHTLGQSVSTHRQQNKVWRAHMFTYIQSDKACLLTDSRAKCDGPRCSLTYSRARRVYSQITEQSVTDPGVHLHTVGQGVFTHRQQSKVWRTQVQRQPDGQEDLPVGQQQVELPMRTRVAPLTVCTCQALSQACVRPVVNKRLYCK